MTEHKVANFYQFAHIEAPQALAASIEAACASLGLLGSVLIAREGINGALTGSDDALHSILQQLRLMPEVADMPATFTCARGESPFRRLRVRVRDEIVTFGAQYRADDGDAAMAVHALSAREWHALLDQPGVLLIDVRNLYETALGGFPGAIDPGTNSFTEFRDFVRNELATGNSSGDKSSAGNSALHLERPIAMYCTGGIRCTKAGAWMRQQGFSQVYELQGGVLGYLQSVAPEDNRWQGNCFVFDERVSVDRNLEPGNERLCGACGWPWAPTDSDAAAQRRCPGCRTDEPSAEH